MEKKWYKYGWNENGNGREIRRVDAVDYIQRSYLLEAFYPCNDPSIIDVGEHVSVTTYTAFPVCSYFQQGSTVVYPHVTEYTGLSDIPEGKTEYNFTDFTDYWYDGTMRGQRTEIPKYSYNWKCGKLASKVVSDSTGKVVYSFVNLYEEINRKDYLNLRVLPYYHIYGTASAPVKECFSNYGALTNFLDGSLHDYYNYYVTDAIYAVKESEEYKDGVYKTTHYKYNDFGQIAEETTMNSDGKEQTIRRKYTCDFWKDAMSGSIYDKMYWANMLAPALETSTYEGELLVNKITNEYKDWGKFIALENVKQLNYYEPRIKYHSYDAYGNPTHVSKDNDFEDTFYIWGHKGQRVIASITGGSFSSLGQTLIDRVTSAAYPSPADMAAIEALRNNPSLKNARLTTYYYDSALNLQKLVMPNGTTTSYEYDSFGRLARVKDGDGKIVESYQYNYKQ